MFCKRACGLSEGHLNVGRFEIPEIGGNVGQLYRAWGALRRMTLLGAMTSAASSIFPTKGTRTLEILGVPSFSI